MAHSASFAGCVATNSTKAGLIVLRREMSAEPRLQRLVEAPRPLGAPHLWVPLSVQVQACDHFGDDGITNDDV